MKLSRREYLRALAAAGAAGLGGCAWRDEHPGLTGGFDEPSASVGHRLREGLRPTPDRIVETQVAIVGAGVAGLSAAWALEAAGVTDFVVLELDDRAGGTARAGASAVTPYPWGAHYVPTPWPDNTALVKLLEEVGAVEAWDAAGRAIYAEDVLCREPQERLHYRGEWHEGLFPYVGVGAEDERQLAAFEAEMARWSRWRDARGRRAFELPRLRGSDAAEVRALDAISMAEYLDRNGWTSPRLRWLVDYACRDDFGGRPHQVSAWAGVHYFAARGPEDAGDVNSGFLTWPEGNARLVAHLAGRAGERLRPNALVASVRQEPRGVLVVYQDVGSGESVGVRARDCVFALPRFLASRLVDDLPAERAEPLAAIEYGAWVVANLHLDARPLERGAPLAWDNVLYDSASLGYVVATHQSGPDLGPTVFTHYTPLLGDDPRADRERLLAASWETCAERALSDLDAAHPELRERVSRVDVCRWGHAMVRPRPGLMWGDALSAAREPVGRTVFAHTDLSGMALVEEAQYWGVRAAEQVMRRAGHGFASLLG